MPNRNHQEAFPLTLGLALVLHWAPVSWFVGLLGEFNIVIDVFGRLSIDYFDKVEEKKNRFNLIIVFCNSK